MADAVAEKQRLPNNKKLAERTFALAAEAKARFDVLLAQHDHRFNPHEQRIANSIRESLDQLSEQLFVAAKRLRLGGDGRHRRAYAAARDMMLDIKDIHAALWYLTVPDVPNEGIAFLNVAWKKLRSQPLPEASREALIRPPAICLSGEMQPSEHSLQTVSVVALAKLEYQNPLSWPLLVHELGHAALGELVFPVPADRPWLRHWLFEMGCDVIGLHLAGPAYLAAFILQSLTERAFLGGTIGRMMSGSPGRGRR